MVYRHDVMNQQVTGEVGYSWRINACQQVVNEEEIAEGDDDDDVTDDPVILSCTLLIYRRRMTLAWTRAVTVE